ncbi:MAG TPA: hypothetical protein VGR36_00925 [Candidatus Acidoferrales bacterium]|nr:hypothetical protein [Candidatus Acidoferrales bacterium]
MIASLIFVLSLGALAQFAVSYCRTLLLNSNEITLSTRLQEVAGVSEYCSPADFDRIVQLIRFAPQMRDDAGQMRAISLYYRLTRVVSTLVSPLSREASNWFDSELSRCSHFAAVALDRRLATAAK